MIMNQPAYMRNTPMIPQMIFIDAMIVFVTWFLSFLFIYFLEEPVKASIEYGGTPLFFVLVHFLIFCMMFLMIQALYIFLCWIFAVNCGTLFRTATFLSKVIFLGAPFFFWGCFFLNDSILDALLFVVFFLAMGFGVRFLTPIAYFILIDNDGYRSWRLDYDPESEISENELKSLKESFKKTKKPTRQTNYSQESKKTIPEEPVLSAIIEEFEFALSEALEGIELITLEEPYPISTVGYSENGNALLITHRKSQVSIMFYNVPKHYFNKLLFEPYNVDVLYELSNSYPHKTLSI